MVWLLLKNLANLDSTGDEPRRLKEALELNQPLAACYTKKNLRQLWHQPDKVTAQAFLAGWVERAKAPGVVAMLIRFANTLIARKVEITNPGIRIFEFLRDCPAPWHK